MPPAPRLSAAAELALVNRHGLHDISPATARWLTAAAHNLADFLGDVPLDRVTPADIARWHAAEAERVSAVTANSYLRAVKTLYSRLQRRRLVAVNPAGPVPFLPEPPPDPKAICRDDYRAMRDAAANVRDKAILDVLWSSGCRLGGLLSMRIDRMEKWGENGRTCYAFRVTEKGSKTRYVYVGRDYGEGDALGQWLEERPWADNPALWLAFRYPFAPMAGSTVQGILRKLAIEAGCHGRPHNPHAFRHAFALRMLDEGEDLAAVSAWLGHASPTFTAEVYAVRSETDLRNKYFRR